MTEGRTTSLVLGSGGAKGLAHIGVIRCLEDRGYRIRYVAGSSIGALVGGIYAAGELETYADWVKALRRTEIVRLLDWSFDRRALFKGDRIVDAMRELVGERQIEELPIGFTAVATDLAATGTRREVWLKTGPLFDAIRASTAVPTIFSPVEKDGRLLVDGGVVNPVPVAPTLNDRTEITIAVNLNGPMSITTSGPLPPAEETSPNALQGAYQQSIGRFVDKLFPGDGDDKPRIGFSDVATRSMETMQATITQFRLAASSPDITINLPRNLCGFFDFHRAGELMEYGYSRAEQALDAHSENERVGRSTLE